MIHLMLADLGWPADEFLALFFPVPVVVFDFDVLVPLCFPHAWQGEATFFSAFWRRKKRSLIIGFTICVSFLFRP